MARDGMEMDRTPAAVIFGVGPLDGIGGAMVRKVATEGMAVFAAGRNKDKLQQVQDAVATVVPLVADVTRQDEVRRVFDTVAAHGCRPDLVVFNVGGNWPMSFLDITPEFMETMWRQGPLAGLLVGQEAVIRGAGTVIFTGASASLRGKPMFAAFASAKAGLRAVAQSMAREFGPQGIHVAHVVIDGAVNGDRVRTLLPGYLEAKGENAGLSPEAIAETYWMLYRQPRSAWTHELELRPFAETW